MVVEFSLDKNFKYLQDKEPFTYYIILSHIMNSHWIYLCTRNNVLIIQFILIIVKMQKLKWTVWYQNMIARLFSDVEQ